jgi:uncharacterized protein
MDGAPLRADHTVAYRYRRSVGGAEARFLDGLAKAEIWGSRGADGRIHVPPIDHDPATGAPSEGFVEVAGTGVVRSWTWVAEPGPEHPSERPFAFALVQLDGADTALLHVVDVGAERDMATGMRVRADWRPERGGTIRDIRAFVPIAEAAPRMPMPVGGGDDREVGPLEVVSDRVISYLYEPGRAMSGFLEALAQRRIIGGRCRSCASVYVPPRPQCPACRAGALDTVPLGDRGVLTAYTVVHVPFPEMTVELPFVAAWIRLDGADVPFPHLLGEVGPGEVQVGQRVEAVWVAADEVGPSWESIRHFRPLPSPSPEGAP